MVATEDVCYIEACRDFCKLTDSDGHLHTISSPIGTLTHEMNPELFYRINRSYIINIEFIVKIVAYSKTRLSLTVRGLANPVITST